MKRPGDNAAHGPGGLGPEHVVRGPLGGHVRHLLRQELRTELVVPDVAQEEGGGGSIDGRCDPDLMDEFPG